MAIQSGKNRAMGYGEFVKADKKEDMGEVADITNMSDADKKKLAIKRRLMKMKKGTS
jgi:hypothetical protein